MANSSLGDQELGLLKFITEHGPMTVRDATVEYGCSKGLARTTILTMMERLREKGYLTRSEGKGSINVYSPVVTKTDLMKGVVRNFVETALEGSLSPFVAYLADEGRLSAKELDALVKLVEELKTQEEPE